MTSPEPEHHGEDQGTPQFLGARKASSSFLVDGLEAFAYIL